MIQYERRIDVLPLKIITHNYSLHAPNDTEYIWASSGASGFRHTEGTDIQSWPIEDREQWARNEKKGALSIQGCQRLLLGRTHNDCGVS
jgi:hypothetical protein